MQKTLTTACLNYKTMTDQGLDPEHFKNFLLEACQVARTSFEMSRSLLSPDEAARKEEEIINGEMAALLVRQACFFQTLSEIEE